MPRGPRRSRTFRISNGFYSPQPLIITTAVPRARSCAAQPRQRCGASPAGRPALQPARRWCWTAKLSAPRLPRTQRTSRTGSLRHGSVESRFWSCVPPFVEVSIPVVRSPGRHMRSFTPALPWRPRQRQFATCSLSLLLRCGCDQSNCRAERRRTAATECACRYRRNRRTRCRHESRRAQHHDAAIPAVHAIQRFRPV
jgi:hypothetical protein